MYDDLRYRAGTVLGECAATGFVLGGVSAFGAVLVAGAIAGSANRPVVLVAYGWICAGLGSAVGTTVGLGVGVALYLLVRWGEPRLGARVVARLIPAVDRGRREQTPLLVQPDRRDLGAGLPGELVDGEAAHGPDRSPSCAH